MPFPAPERPGPAQPHHARQVAESFGTDAQGYDRARPGYPDDLVGRIVAGSPGPGVLDVGCGTGIAARQFQAAGCAVLGVEPDARMADVARARGLPVEVATFESWEPAGRTFDAVTAAQSWHWVDAVAGAQKAARVLRPDGRPAISGHVFEPPREVAEPFADAYRRAVPDSPLGTLPARRPVETYWAQYATVADRIRETESFDDPEPPDSRGDTRRRRGNPRGGSLPSAGSSPGATAGPAAPPRTHDEGLSMPATAHEVADTLNRAFEEPTMTMATLLADVIPALAEFDQAATTAADPEDYRDRIVLHDGSIVLYDTRTERWTVSSTAEVAASDRRRLTSP